MLDDKTQRLKTAIISSGNELTIRIWIDQGARFDLADPFGENALHWAAQAGNVALCRRICLAGVGVDSLSNSQATPLHRAAIKGSAEACSILLRHGANVHLRDELGLTALHYAAISGDPGTCRRLIMEGAVLDVANNRDELPLHLAIRHGYIEAVGALLEAGANHGYVPVGRHDTYLTPFQSAVSGGKIDSFRLMLDRFGALFDDVTVDGRSLFDVARGEPEMLEELRSNATLVAVGASLCEADNSVAARSPCVTPL
jgi:ankyrin repeat protein